VLLYGQLQTRLHAFEYASTVAPAASCAAALAAAALAAASAAVDCLHCPLLLQ